MRDVLADLTKQRALLAFRAWEIQRAIDALQVVVNRLTSTPPDPR